MQPLKKLTKTGCCADECGYEESIKLLAEMRKGHCRFSDVTIEHTFKILKNHSSKLGQ